MEFLTNKKYFAKFLLCLTLFSTLQPVLAAPTPAVAKKASRYDRIAKKLNLSSRDLTTILIVSSGLLALSCATTSPALKVFLRIAAIIPPIVAITLPKKAVDAIAKVPGLRQYFHFRKSSENGYCENKSCDGFCPECKAVRIYWMMPLIGIPFLIRFIMELDAQIVERERQEQEERIARQCQQCRNRERNQQTPCCNRNICHICIAYNQCPFCHVNTPAYQERLNREARERQEQLDREARERQERLDREARWRQEREERIARRCHRCNFRDRNQQTPCCNRNICLNCSGYMNNAYAQCPLCQANTPAHQERVNREARERQERQEREHQIEAERQERERQLEAKRQEREARQCVLCNTGHYEQTSCCNRNICPLCSLMYTSDAYGRCPFCHANTPVHQERLNREAREQRQERERQDQLREDLKRAEDIFHERIRGLNANEFYRRLREQAEQTKRAERQQLRPQPINHYQILGVAQNASEAEIRRAFRQLALQFHPDKAAANNIPLEEAHRRMEQVNEANEILSNPEARREYDQNR